MEKAGTGDLYLYADDLKVFNEISSDEDVDKLQCDLDRLYDWTQYSLLKFHPDKCVAMRLTPSKSRKLPLNLCYSMDETRLKTVEREKDLGLIFDNTLSFEDHINSKVSKSNSLVGMLRRSFVHFDKEMFKQLFVSIVRPHIEYGAAVWNPSSKKMITSIENVQRRASKLVPGLGDKTYKERLKSMKLPTLQYRRYRGDMIETYKLAHGLYDTNVSKELLKFQSNTARGHNLRGHQFMIEKECYRKDVRKFSFKCRVANQWNNLPETIVNAPSLNTFKNRLDKLWEREEIMYDPDVDIYTRTSSRRTRYEIIEEQD